MNKEIIDGIITGGIWKASSVEQTPEILITSFQVYELENGDRHLVGWNETEGEGRVTSKIVSFDKPSRTVVTNSGRKYKLGHSGTNMDAMYVWSSWKRINSVDGFHSVTEEYS